MRVPYQFLESLSWTNASYEVMMRDVLTVGAIIISEVAGVMLDMLKITNIEQDFHRNKNALVSNSLMHKIGVATEAKLQPGLDKIMHAVQGLAQTELSDLMELSQLEVESSKLRECMSTCLLERTNRIRKLSGCFG